jgi:transposase-like protein
MSIARRNYDNDFKINAIKLYLGGNKSFNILAGELGIPKATFAK